MDDARKPASAGTETFPAGDVGDHESRSPVSREIESLFQYLVERAHDAVDQLAERAAPALGQVSEGLLARVLPDENRSLHEDRPFDAPGRGGSNALVLREPARPYLTIVRDHPMAVLAVAVAAGFFIRQFRAR